MKKIYFFLALWLLLACDDGSSSNNNQNNNTNNHFGPEICNDGLDNDGDAFFDCWDEDCEGSEYCKQGEDVCGNGIKESGEYCDMYDFGEDSCQSHGYSAGELFCTSHCSISLLACTLCGNDVCEAGENTLNCSQDCLVEVENNCGNGNIDEGEDCDGNTLGGESCLSLQAGYTGGNLRCTSNCIFDYSACEFCGDGVCEAGETASTCMIDCSLGPNICGNAFCESGEDENNCPDDCSGEDYICGDGICSIWEDPQSCAADCEEIAVCGNSSIEGDEDCDGVDLAGLNCLSFSFDGGYLTCDSNCHFDTSACWECGNGICENNLGENASNCASDCLLNCSTDDFVLDKADQSLELYGMTGDCGNRPYNWGEDAYLMGDAVLFNVNDSGFWRVWWSGAACNESTLHWDLSDLYLDFLNVGTCWVICTSSGAHVCCSVTHQVPAICGSGTEPKVEILVDTTP